MSAAGPSWCLALDEYLDFLSIRGHTVAQIAVAMAMAPDERSTRAIEARLQMHQAGVTRTPPDGEWTRQHDAQIIGRWKSQLISWDDILTPSHPSYIGKGRMHVHHASVRMNRSCVRARA